MTTYVIERESKEIRSLGKSEYRQFVFNFTGLIEEADTVATISGNDAQGKALGVTDSAGVLTIGTAARNSSGSILVDKRTVLVNKAVTVFLGASGATTGTIYSVTCRVVTTTGQTIELVGLIRCEEPA